MTNTKNNIPIYVEEQTVQQKIKIPTNFVELQRPKKNNWGSTEGLDKKLCERYTFKYDNKSITLDITQELREKLGLKENENCLYPIYIRKELLKKKPEENGITVDNEKDILCQKERTILTREKEIQVDFTTGEITDLKQKLEASEKLSEETQKLLERVAKDNEEKHIAIIFFEEQIRNLTQRITELRRDLEQEKLDKKREESKNRELERIIRELRKNEQVLIGLQNNFTERQTELGNQITTLTNERNNIQRELDNLENKLRRIKRNFLGSLFIGISKSSKKSKEIKELKVQRVRLRKELIDKDQQIVSLRNTITNLNNQINQLTTQRDNLQTQVNNLTGTVRNRDQTITNLNNQISSLNSQLNSARHEANKVSGLNSQLYSLQSEISSLRNKINGAEDLIYSEYACLNIFSGDSRDCSTSFQLSSGSGSEWIVSDIDNLGILSAPHKVKTKVKRRKVKVIESRSLDEKEEEIHIMQIQRIKNRTKIIW